MIRVKFWLYCLSTQLIIWLGLFRDWLNVPMQQRHDRTFYASNVERSECCDCGLVHVVYPLYGEPERERHYRLVPLRVQGYKYQLRHGAGKPSAFVDESGRDRWTGKPCTKGGA